MDSMTKKKTSPHVSIPKITAPTSVEFLRDEVREENSDEELGITDIRVPGALSDWLSPRSRTIDPAITRQKKKPKSNTSSTAKTSASDKDAGNDGMPRR